MTSCSCNGPCGDGLWHPMTIVKRATAVQAYVILCHCAVCQVSMNPDTAAKKLLQQCKNRWTSIYSMFEFDRLVEVRWPVCAVLSDHNIVKAADDRTLQLKDEHRQMMADMLPVLKSLQIATSVMSAEQVDDHLKVDADDSTTVSTFKGACGDAI